MKTAEKAKRRVFVVDDHAVLRYGLSELISGCPDLEICGQAGSAEEALASIGSASPDLAILDITLPGMSGLELIKTLKEKCPAVQILVLSMHDETIYARRAVRAGARGYIMKQRAINEVVDAVRRILDGDLYLSQAMSRHVLEAAFRSDNPVAESPVTRLTDRELEVFRLIGQWKGATEIAQRLKLSIKTVETYQAKLKEKLGLKDSTQLLYQALRWVHEPGE